MDKIEIVVNGEKLLELDKTDIETIQTAEEIPDANFKECVKSWSTMIFLHRLRKAQETLIKYAEGDQHKNLYERNGIAEIPANMRKKIILILQLIKTEKSNDSTSIYS